MTSPLRLARRGADNEPPVSRALPLAACAAMAIVAPLSLSCGAPDDGGAKVGAAPPAGAHIIFQLDGVPGPWWRPGGQGDAFEAEHRDCLARSREARAQPGQADPADAAYRSFLACMVKHGWVRGLPPSPQAAAAAGADA